MFLRRCVSVIPIRRLSVYDNFSATDLKDVLDFINTSPDSQLEHYSSKIFLKNLLAEKKIHGQFESIDAILRTPGITERSLTTFITKYKTPSFASKFPMARFVAPVPDPFTLMSIETVVSICVNRTIVAIAQMDRTRRILNWKAFFCENDGESRKNSTLRAKFERCMEICEEVPVGSCYLLEECGHFKSMSDTNTMKTIIYTMLGLRDSASLNVHHVKNHSVARYFNLQMGNDQVSCQLLFEKHIDRDQIKLSRELRAEYHSKQGVKREYLALMSLQCLAFFEICNISTSAVKE